MATTYFLGLGVDDQIRSTMIDMTAELSADISEGVRWVEPAGMHITLRYFGKVDETDLLRESLPTVIASCSEFELAVQGLGAFPDVHTPEVLWAGLGAGRDSLLALHDAIEPTVNALGFAPDRRSFSPHLTLGFVDRDASEAQLAQVSQIVSAHATTKSLHYGSISVTEVILYASNPGPSGSVFTPIQHFSLS